MRTSLAVRFGIVKATPLMPRLPSVSLVLVEGGDPTDGRFWEEAS
jgi:hypothetical protein